MEQKNDFKDILSAQWENLCSDFAGEFDRLADKGVDGFNDWYATRIHRWQSVAYSEGIILEQQEDEALSQALVASMKAFRFEKELPCEQRPLWIGAAGAVAAGVAAAVVLKLLRWPLWRVLLSGIVLSGVIFASVWKSHQAAEEAEAKRIREAYVEQLRQQGKALEALVNADEPTSGEAN